ncbi:dockerin type I domain-containing protein [Lacipirellula limnantheis]|uniref:Ice-binding protein C-terminal domain-containing protein n=1 Tax=Lacipirellula limnantheis TaxID=2528024 RepID=A0A517TYW3_9BACT|nr:dockerin type I domain-containing protein [Lacipirellula limnantheis]QDT73564.1 hypothetical protein I41_27530 [Lacipirellula limnantheis]
MLSQRTFWTFTALAGLALAPMAARAQAIFADDDFLAADYDVSGSGNQDVRFNFNYAAFDIFGDGFLVNSAAGIPVAPRTTDGSKTGVFVSANNNSLNALTESFAAILPKNVNVGVGTSNPNYVLRVDVFNSTGAGIDDGAGNISLTGTTNYTVVGLNQANTTVQLQSRNAPGGGANLAGQGLALAITGDSGAGDDWAPIYGGARYQDRKGTNVAGQFYSGNSVGLKSGLLGQYLNDYWAAQALGFTVTDPGSAAANATELSLFTGDSLYFAPDPANTAGYLSDGSGAAKTPLVDSFPIGSQPLHYSQPSLGAPSVLAPNGSGVIADGIISNEWATHELYWVNGEFTYVIDGTPVAQFTPTASNTFTPNPVSQAGTAFLGFWDRFGGSLAVSPEGANFAIYDNLEIKPATAAEVPDMLTYLGSKGYLLAAASNADFNSDGSIDGADFLIWQRGLGLTGQTGKTNGDANSDTVVDAADLAIWKTTFGTTPAAAAVGAVPEPATYVLGALAVLGLAVARRTL